MDEEVKRRGKTRRIQARGITVYLGNHFYLLFWGEGVKLMFYCQTENVESAFWKEEGDIELCSFFFLFCFFLSLSLFFFLSLLPFHLFEYAIYLYSSKLDII